MKFVSTKLCRCWCFHQYPIQALVDMTFGNFFCALCDSLPPEASGSRCIQVIYNCRREKGCVWAANLSWQLTMEKLKTKLTMKTVVFMTKR